MLANKQMDTERIIKAIRQYERRLVICKKASTKFYHLNHDAINTKRVIDGIRHGRTPNRVSVEKYDRDAIAAAWCEFVKDKTELSERARKFHRYITGREWVCEIN